MKSDNFESRFMKLVASRKKEIESGVVIPDETEYNAHQQQRTNNENSPNHL